MGAQDEIYGVCRDYIFDLRPRLCGLDVVLMGYTRARDIKNLTSCSSLFDQALHSVEVLRALRQIEAFFKKNSVFVDEERCLEASQRSFLNSEKLCRIANRRLDFYYLQRDRLDPDLKLWMSRAEQYIARVLGSFTPFLEELPSLIKVTSGATATRSRRLSLPYLKVTKRNISCTPRARPYLLALSRYFGYGDLSFKTQTWNRVEAVPKNWKTHRTIACEPAGNIPLQLAFDRYVKGRLRRYGIDLSDQTRNQELARRASKDGTLCTIDLSAASDTLAFNTVAWLLPQSWFQYLSDLRSESYRGTFGEGRYAKFSSMGNGATFALETLVFAACAYAVGSKEYSVYGDDIIVETDLYPKIARLLRFLGFTPNPDKSYHTGLFRESCGSDCYDGIDITPFYLREWGSRSNVASHNVNGLVSISEIEGRIWERCRNLSVSARLQCVPFNLDSMSGVFIDVSHAYRRRLLRPSNSITRYRAYVTKSRMIYVGDSRTLFLWFLQKTIGSSSPREVVSSRVPTLCHKYVRKWVGWFPAVGSPDYLYWWSEFLFAAGREACS